MADSIVNDTATDARKITLKGFYWVKVEANTHERDFKEHWEPAYFNGDAADGWALCGEDPAYDEDCFLDIKPMVLPRFD